MAQTNKEKIELNKAAQITKQLKVAKKPEKPPKKNSTEDSQQFSEIRYRTMIDQSPLSVQILAPSGETLQVNKAWEDLWGATIDQIKGYNMLKDKQLVQLGIMPYIKRGFSGNSANIPAVKYQPSDSIEGLSTVPYRWVRAFIYPVKDEKGRLREVVLMHEDITEQKKAEEALRESEEHLRFMAESVPQKVFTAEPNGDVDYFNPQWIEFTGLSFEEIKNWGWTQFIHSDDLEENIRTWKHSIETGEPFELEHRFRRHDGVYCWHISRALPLRDESGKIIKWFGSNTDIHDIKLSLQREKDLRSKAASLSAQRKELEVLNQALKEFISLASHQLRTPATGVKQYLGLLHEGFAGKLTKEQEDFVEKAYQGNQRQLDIIDDLLIVARVDAGKMSLNRIKLNLVELINEVINEQISKFESRRQEIHFKNKETKLEVSADPARIRMVLENLIDNAGKYTPEAKKISIEATKDKEFVAISVIDEGVGIKPSDFNKLFQKFSRLENPLSISSGGTGLGLYLAKKIVELHGGFISVQSSPEKGSTFTVKLPL